VRYSFLGFKVSFAHLLIEAEENRQKALDEIIRVLKPSGRIAI